MTDKEKIKELEEENDMLYTAFLLCNVSFKTMNITAKLGEYEQLKSFVSEVTAKCNLALEKIEILRKARGVDEK